MSSATSARLPQASSSSNGSGLPLRATKTRSRGACDTCRNRKKKCDETRLPEHGGSCERCFLGSYECKWPLPLGQRPLKTFVRGVRGGKTANRGEEASVPPTPVQAQDDAPEAGSSSEALFSAAAAAEASASFELYPSPSAIPQLSHLSTSTSSQYTSSSSHPPPLALGTHFDNSSFSFAPDQPQPVASSSSHLTSSSDADLWAFTSSSSSTALAALPSLQPPITTHAGPPLDPLYRRLTEGLALTLPYEFREMAIVGLMNLAESSILNRNAANATSNLCRLAQHASRRPPPADILRTAAWSFRQEQLEQEGATYVREALRYLALLDLPLAARLLACYDLSTYQYDRFGNEACNAVLLVADFFVTQKLGPSPLIDFSLLNDFTGHLVHPFVWLDVLRCLCLGSRRPHFSFPSLPGSSSFSPVTPPGAFSPFPGIPVVLMLCMAAIAELDMDRKEGKVGEEEVREKAGRIEGVLREWKPDPPTGHEVEDLGKYFEEVQTQEMWRQAIIIYLYQSIHHHSPVSRVLISCMQAILKIGVPLLDSYIPPSSALAADTPTSVFCSNGDPTVDEVTAWSEKYYGPPAARSGPFFLAGTVALHPHDRALCRRGVIAAGPLRGFQDNLDALERIWAVQDETGRCEDWREVLKRQEPVMWVGLM
ncbi:hypothetical protein JCM8547_006654 [Rhodosporidiobolus lusitaniae]